MRMRDIEDALKEKSSDSKVKAGKGKDKTSSGKDENLGKGGQPPQPPNPAQRLAERLTMEDSRLQEAHAEIEGIQAQLETLDLNVQGLSPEAVQGQKNLLSSKYNAAVKVWRKALFEAALAGRWKAWRALQSMDNGQPLMPWSPVNPNGLTMDDLQKVAELDKETMAQAAEGLLASQKKVDELIKDMQAEIVRLNSEIEQIRMEQHASIAQKFDEAPLYIARKHPKEFSELIGEPLNAMQTTKPASPTGNEVASPAKAGSVASDSYNEQMLAAITEENIAEAVNIGKVEKFGNEEIWRYIRRKAQLPDMDRIPQGQRSRIYLIRTKMLKEGRL